VNAHLGLLRPCMGGWCTLRDHCPHYHAARPGTKPSERLCYPGRDGESDVVQVVRIVRPRRPAAA